MLFSRGDCFWVRSISIISILNVFPPPVLQNTGEILKDFIFFTPWFLVRLLVCLLLLRGKCLQVGREIGRLETHLGCLHFKFWPLCSIVVKTNQVKSNWWNIQTKREWKSPSIKIFPDSLQSLGSSLYTFKSQMLLFYILYYT